MACWMPSASALQGQKLRGSPCSMNTSGKPELQYWQGNARNIQGFVTALPTAMMAPSSTVTSASCCEATCSSRSTSSGLAQRMLTTVAFNDSSCLQCGYSKVPKARMARGAARSSVARVHGGSPLAEGQASSEAKGATPAAAAARVTHGNRVVLFKAVLSSWRHSRSSGARPCSCSECSAQWNVVRIPACVAPSAPTRPARSRRIRRAGSARPRRGSTGRTHAAGRWVDRHDRLHAFAGQTGGKGHGMLLGNADVESSGQGSAFQTPPCPSLRAWRGDAHQSAILRRHVAQPLTKHLGEGLLGGVLLTRPTAGVELAGPW